MTISIFRDQQEMARETALLIARILNEKPSALLCFPAGSTSISTFSELVKLHREAKTNFSHCSIVGLDEWVGLGQMQNENCYHFLHEHLFRFLDLKPDQLHFFNGESDDLKSECELTDTFIADHGGIDLMLLGAGMNGHLGLNEPGISPELNSHVIELDTVTRLVGQKYFSAKVALTKGITLGLRQVMEARLVILQINGSHKAPVYRKLFEGKAERDFPASILHQHHNAILMADEAAAGAHPE